MFKNTKGAYWTITGLVTLSLMLAGCGNASRGTSGNETSTSASGVCSPDEVGPGVTDSRIQVGTTMPLTGSGAATGIATRDGQQAYYDMINEQGGVKDRQIELTVLDDEYDPSTAQSRMRQLVEQEEILAVSGGEGTPNFLGAVPYLKRSNIPAVAPYAPSNELGSMDNPNVFMAAVDYITEFEVVTKYILENDDPKKVALVAVSGSVGEDSKLGIENAIGDNDVELLYIPEEAGTTDFTPIVTELSQFGAQYVYLVLTNADTGGILSAMERVGFTPQTVSWGGMSDDAYIEEYASVSQDMIVALETANLDSEDPAIKEFMEAYEERTGKQPSKFNQQGWVQAQLMVEALERTEGLNRPCLIAALETFDEFETGIYPPITWGPEQRAGVSSVGIARIEGDTLTVLQDVK